MSARKAKMARKVARALRGVKPGLTGTKRVARNAELSRVAEVLSGMVPTTPRTLPLGAEAGTLPPAAGYSGDEASQ